MTAPAMNHVVRLAIFPTESFTRAASPTPPMPKLDSHATIMAYGAERTVRPDTATFINLMDTISVPHSIVVPFAPKRVIVTSQAPSLNPAKWSSRHQRRQQTPFPSPAATLSPIARLRLVMSPGTQGQDRQGQRVQPIVIAYPINVSISCPPAHNDTAPHCVRPIKTVSMEPHVVQEPSTSPTNGCSITPDITPRPFKAPPPYSDSVRFDHVERTTKGLSPIVLNRRLRTQPRPFDIV